jgi:hypothetical protein
MASIAMLVITGGYIISDYEGNGMIITSDYGSFPHSPHLAPVSLLVSHSLSHYYPSIIPSFSHYHPHKTRIISRPIPHFGGINSHLGVGLPRAHEDLGRP